MILLRSVVKCVGTGMCLHALLFAEMKQYLSAYVKCLCKYTSPW